MKCTRTQKAYYSQMVKWVYRSSPACYKSIGKAIPLCHPRVKRRCGFHRPLFLQLFSAMYQRYSTHHRIYITCRCIIYIICICVCSIYVMGIYASGENYIGGKVCWAFVCDLFCFYSVRLCERYEKSAVEFFLSWNCMNTFWN